MLSQSSLRRTSLLALLVLLWGLVFPTLANAGVGDTNAVWTEICTAQGIKKIQQTDDAHPAQVHQYAAEHCALCCLGGALPGAVALPLIDGLRLEYRTAALPAAQITLPQQIILLSASPRAPPVLFMS